MGITQDKKRKKEDRRIIGIDLGGTNLRIGCIDGSTLGVSDMISSEVIEKAEDPIGALSDVIHSFLADNSITDIDAVSIGVPSSVANDKRTVICPTNLLDRNGDAIFQNTDLAGPLEKRFGKPVFINRDTNNNLLYDIFKYNLQDNYCNIGIYIGTGVGASVFIDGVSFDGANGAALDLGHVPFYKGTEPCHCSKTGCCECYASGWKLQKIQESLYPNDRIRELFLKHGKEKPLMDIVYSCAYIFAVMATIFNPDTIVAGGGVLEMQAFLREEFEKQVKDLTGLDVMTYGYNLVYSEPFLGKGILGAAFFANKQLDQEDCI